MSVAAIILAFLRYGPNIMLYPGAFEPYPREVHLPSAWGLEYEDLTLTTSDKVKIRAYLLLQPGTDTGDRKCSLDYSASSDHCLVIEHDQRPTVLMFHGNCDNIGFTLPLARIFVKRMRCNVLMLSPRGFGNSEGRPSTKGLKRDADAALRFILSHPRLSNGPIVLYGQSLGGAMAIDLAGRRSDKISALIIENTFTSLRRLIPDIMSIFSFAAPFFGQWNSAQTLERLPRRVAVLMLSGKQDEVIPPKHMQQLWEIATSNPKTATVTPTRPRIFRWRKKKSPEINRDDGPPRHGRFLEIPRGSHNDTWGDPAYWDEIEMFLESLTAESCAK